MTDFPFNIRDVISALNIPVRRADGNFLYIDCPACYQQNTAKKGKCQVRLDDNIFNCPRCGTGGGMLKLYSLVTGCNRKDANRIMREYIKKPTFNAKREQEEYQKAVESAPKLVKLAPKSVIDRTYRLFLAACVLREEHRNNLIRRGLCDKEISHYGFRSVPFKNECKAIIEQLLESGCSLKGVPGFYEEQGEWKIAASYKNRGFFVPMINIKGQCLGLQIRLDSPTHNAKYIWFSSARYDNGCARTSIPTFSNIWQIGNSVCITEGGLKAYVAHAHSGVTFIGIPGVTQYKLLPLLFSQLQKRGVTTIADCFDMDYKTNPNVQQARKRLKAEIINAGFRYVRYEWDERYKGIDDYFTAVPPEQRHLTAIK